MKLACVRCKHKKIKCDRGEPTCHQCVTAKIDCHYVERRKRLRLGHDRGTMQHLSQRLESLEKQLIAEQSRSSISPSQTSVGNNALSTNITSPEGSPNDGLVEENGRDSWIYRLATDARRGFLEANTGSPAHTDNAMSTLNEALDDLGKLKIRVIEERSSTNALNLSSAESRECIDTFLHLFRDIFMIEIFGMNGIPEVSTLYSFAELVSSPYVTFDAVLHVLYWNAVYYGLHQTYGPNEARTQAAYRKVLNAVPAWLASPAETDLDGWTAALTAWTAIVNFDYQLSWKFHCKSCHFIQQRGLDRIDVVPAATNEEEAERDDHRPLYWHALWCDMFFRLFYGKPSVLPYVPNNVKPLDVMASRGLRPKASRIMIAAVFIQGTIMTADILHYIDTASSQDRANEVPQRVEQFCLAIDELVSDWNLENQLMWERTPTVMRHVMADYLMSLFSVMIGVKRLTRRLDPENPVDQTTLRAARKVVSIVVDHAAPFMTDQHHRFISLQFISFYPFCAVFSLYEYILACKNPEDCEADLRSLEALGSVMVQASALRTDFATMSNTINALNKVSRTFHDDRKRNTPLPAPDSPTTVEGHSHMQHQQASGFVLPTSIPNVSEAPRMPQLQYPAPNAPTFPEFTGDGYLDALDFVRSLETDFLERNWHEEWWTIDHSIDPTVQ